MARGTIYIEETHTATIGIVRLLLFLGRYFRPFKKHILATLLLALCAVTADLALPQMLKIAMDSYLTATARKLELPAAGPFRKNFFKHYRHLLLDSGNGSEFFLLPGNFTRLAIADKEYLEKRGLLDPDSYYASRLPSPVAVQYPQLFRHAGAHCFIRFANLAKLDAADRRLLRRSDSRGLARITAVFLTILLFSFVFNFSQIYLVEFASQNIMHAIRLAIFNHLQSRSMSFFTGNPIGRLVTRATNDVQNLHELFNALFANILRDILIILGILGVLFWVSWELSLVCFAVLPPLFIGSALFSLKSRSAFREVRLKIAALNASIQENVTGITVVKAFCREALNIVQFQKLNHANYSANMRQTLIFAIFNPLVDLSRLTAIALIIWYGGGKTIQATMSLGTLVVFLYYMRMFFRPVQDLAEKYNIIQSALASLERLYLLLDDKSMIADSPAVAAPAACHGAIEFRNVTFSYKSDEPVLQNISFRIAPGETVAIVGLTGAGKTTLINLLERFYDVSSGSILLDGTDIRNLNKTFLRRRIGLVMQDVFLFSGSIRSNITLDRNDFSQAAIDTAVQAANVHRVLQQHPGGLSAEVNEGGKTLSAGERQLLSFARAIVKDPEILVLDEATSNIDPVTEGLIQDALKRLMHERTCLVIAHRLSTIKQSDRILVLHKGRIAEQGSHAELLKRQGLYYRLSKIQDML
ncbi:ABC transporter ATP-binding protein [Thermodesulfobacteriota bacterium]